MPNKQTATFPFDFIVMWVRPNIAQMKPERCMFCKEQGVYRLYQTVSMKHILDHGMDAAWRNAIARQLRGDYAFGLYQPVCLEHCIQFAAIQLGKQRPIQQLLSNASLVKKQQEIDLSLVIVSTVRSLDDEGDNWVVAAPNTTIEEVVAHLKTVKRP
jgi:hypothetical protein